MAVLVASFLVTIIITPRFIEKLRKAGIVGQDVHKEKKVQVPEMGGLTILFGVSAGMFISIPFVSADLVYLFAAFLTVLLAGVMGVCDDLFGIRFRTKSLLPLFAAVPLMVVQAGVHTMNIPFWGAVNFGVLYPLVLIPVAITVVANSSNMLAGYNGLEAGMGAIACFFMGLAGLILGKIEVAILTFSMFGACLAFLKYNRYPSRVFIGDVGTFSIGAGIAAAAIIGNMEIIGIVVIAPYILNGLITSLEIVRRKPVQRFSKVKQGILVPPGPRYTQTLYFMMQRAFRLTEKKMAVSMWLLGLMSGVAALAVLLLQI